MCFLFSNEKTLKSNFTQDLDEGHHHLDTVKTNMAKIIHFKKQFPRSYTEMQIT